MSEGCGELVNVDDHLISSLLLSLLLLLNALGILRHIIIGVDDHRCTLVSPPLLLLAAFLVNGRALLAFRLLGLGLDNRRPLLHVTRVVFVIVILWVCNILARK